MDEAFLDFYRGADRQEPPTREDPPGGRPHGRGFALLHGCTDGVAQRVWAHGRLLSVDGLTAGRGQAATAMGVCLWAVGNKATEIPLLRGHSNGTTATGAALWWITAWATWPR